MSVRFSMIAVLLVAACATTARAPAPSSGDPIERHVVALERYAERACACPDRACAAALDTEIAGELAARTPPAVYADARWSRADAAMQRTVACGWRLRHVFVGFEAVALVNGGSMRQAACACHGDACDEDAGRERFIAVFHLFGVPMSEEVMQTYQDTMSAIAACRAKWKEGAP